MGEPAVVIIDFGGLRKRGWEAFCVLATMVIYRGWYPPGNGVVPIEGAGAFGGVRRSWLVEGGRVFLFWFFYL